METEHVTAYIPLAKELFHFQIDPGINEAEAVSIIINKTNLNEGKPDQGTSRIIDVEEKNVNKGVAAKKLLIL